MLKGLFTRFCATPFAQKPGAVLGLALMLFVAFFNPFGLRESSERTTESWLLRMFSPFYPAQAQDDVVVVLIDDQSLSNMNATWPMRYNDQARLIRQLLSHQPKAVFIDLLYSQRRTDGGTTDALRRVLDSAERQNIPLFLADYRTEAGQSLLLPELQKEGYFTQVNWSGYGTSYPLVLRPGQSDSYTPALQLYLQGCAQGECSTDAFNDPLLVRWGFWSDPAMGAVVSPQNCHVRGERSNTRQLLNMLSIDLFRAQQTAVDIERPQPCPYTRTLYIDQLRDPQVGELLKDRYVLIGTQIRGLPDLIDSPVQGRLPGVYWHAMALDNLLSQGPDYWRSAPDLFNDFSISDLLEMLLVLIAGVVALKIPDQPNLHASRMISWMTHYRFWFSALSLLAIGASVALAYIWNIAPLDWLGLILVIGLFYAYLGEPRVATWWEAKISQYTKNKEQRDV